MSDCAESYPYPPELRDLLKRRQEMHHEVIEENEWNQSDGNHLTDTVDPEGVIESVSTDDDERERLVKVLADAFEYGLNEGMMKMAHLGNRVAARECTEVRFTDEESLNDGLEQTYSHSVSVHSIEPHDDGTATVSLDRTWSEIGDNGVTVYRLSKFITATAIPYGDGHAVDFGPRPDLHTAFANARHEADDADIEEVPLQ